MSFAFAKVTFLAFRQAIMCCSPRITAVPAYVTLLVLPLFDPLVGLSFDLELY